MADAIAHLFTTQYGRTVYGSQALRTGPDCRQRPVRALDLMTTDTASGAPSWTEEDRARNIPCRTWLVVTRSGENSAAACSALVTAQFHSHRGAVRRAGRWPDLDAGLQPGETTRTPHYAIGRRQCKPPVTACHDLPPTSPPRTRYAHAGPYRNLVPRVGRCQRAGRCSGRIRFPCAEESTKVRMPVFALRCGQADAFASLEAFLSSKVSSDLWVA